MKKYLLYAVATILLGGMSACSEDGLDSESVITTENRVANDFDKWLQTNYVGKYNIEFQYRLKDIQSDMDYYLVPADYKCSVIMANLVKHLTLETFDEVVGPDFAKTFFPKMITLVGSGGYETNGTMILGTAEEGLRITLYDVNNVNPANMEALNDRYFRTVYHEFGHILNQTKPYSVDFDQITASKYVNDAWSSEFTRAEALQAGFITPYASKEAKEDFVELFSMYITTSADDWNAKLTTAGATGASLIEQKMEIVSNYMKNTWGVDVDAMRNVILRRQDEISSMDLDKLN